VYRKDARQFVSLVSMGGEVRRFWLAVKRHWITLMVGGASIVVTIVGIVGGEKGLLWAFGVIAFGCVVMAFYLAWRDEYRARLAVPWHAAFEENRELERLVREFIRTWPETRTEMSEGDRADALRKSIGGTIHLLSDNWLTQIPHPESDGRKTRTRCLLFRKQLERLPAPDAPFLGSGVMSMTPAHVGDCLEDNRVFLEKRISGILSGSSHA
jgi:hypothetical protein